MADKPEFGVSVGADNIVHLQVSGDIGKDNVSALKEWTIKTEETIQSVYRNTGKKVRCLLDITGFTSYDADILSMISEMMKHNHPYVLKTATFGGSKFMIMAEEIAMALSGRTNLKAFNTKEEALKWLDVSDPNLD